ncbi:sulfotransferase family cytosolic 1B member 1-like isoform X1 [Empidonax traillii]|uniref:sulfotransferase family cytosolic 1B member 1-like isoform X1 n=1 Tax=Empidonax traillii TaxID=164674 RepID=UPI000FFD541D|nr:sulfotransferase family cytosolic 1B member 1-like isoform X1 [Empidonax traillii]
MGQEGIREELGNLHGIPLYKVFIEGWPQVKDFQARPDDLLISTYPKSGTTWLSEIMDMIYQDGDVEKCRRDAIYNRVPFLEVKAPGIPSGVEQLENTPSPRLVKTHLPVQLLPQSFWDKDCKVMLQVPSASLPIWVGREEALLYLPTTSLFVSRSSTWPATPRMLSSPTTTSTRWPKYTLTLAHWLSSWRPFWLAKDPRQEVKKILQFLGKEVVEGTVERILQNTSFQAMKKNPAANYETMPTALMDHNLSPFLRKGICGDWKNHFTVAQNERFDRHYQEHMAGTDLHFQMEM